MRILLIAPFGTCAKQTVPRRILPLAHGLAQAGHEVEALIPAWDCADEAGRVTHDAGVTIRYPRLGPAPHRLADPLLLYRMRQAAAAFAPEVVHVFKAIGYAGAVAGTMLGGQKPPVFVDVDDLESAGGWGAGRNWLARRIVSRQEAQALQRARGVTAASLALRDRVELVRRRTSDTLYLPNGVKPALTPAPVAENPAVVLLYTRGNDVAASRLERVWRRILAAVPDARLHIIGDWAAAPDLPQSRRFGWAPPPELTGLLRAAAVAIFPVEDDARTGAKSPARLLDCLAQGLPVVTANVGEYGRLPGAGGLIVEPGADDALADAVISLLADLERRARLGMLAWERARDHDWSHRVESLLAWYDSRSA